MPDPTVDRNSLCIQKVINHFFNMEFDHSILFLLLIVIFQFSL